MNEIIYAFEADFLSAPGSLNSREQVLAAINTAGFDGLEVPVHPGFLDITSPDDLEIFRGLLNSQGLTAPALVALSPSPFDSFLAPELVQTIHAIDQLAPITHSRIAVIRTTPFPPRFGEESMKTLAGALIQAFNHCDPAGLSVAMEFENAGLMGTYTEIMDWIYFHAPRTGLALDTAALASSGADPYLAATEMAPVLRLVYLTEPLDSQRFNYTQFFSGLKGIKYDGPLALRRLPMEGPALSGAAAALRQLWASAPVEAVAVMET